MYTSIEKIQAYTPVFSDVIQAKKNIAGKVRRIMIAALGREFMELSSTYKAYTLYFCLSLMLLSAWSETRVWLDVLNILNFANAVRLANKAVKSASKRY